MNTAPDPGENHLMPELPRRLISLFVVAVLFNFPWEVAQMPLYVTEGSLLEFMQHGIVPSLGDGLIVLLIFGIGWLLRRRPDWSDRPGIAGYTLMLLTGFALAVLIEWAALSVGRWSYSARMPQMPGLGVGASPILQMLVLPPLIFRVTAWYLNRRQGV